MRGQIAAPHIKLRGGRPGTHTHARTHARTHHERTHTHKPKQIRPQLRGQAGGAAARCEPMERRRSHRFARDLHLYLQTYGEESQHCQQPGEAVGAADSAGQHRRHGTAARVALAAPGHHWTAAARKKGLSTGRKMNEGRL
jgi:hypothetical protein